MITTLVELPACIFYIYLSLFLTIPLGYYRVKQIYHRERYISSFFRGIEFLLVILAVVLGYRIIIVALIYFLLRLVQLVYILFDLSYCIISFEIVFCLFLSGVVIDVYTNRLSRIHFNYIIILNLKYYQL